jgi:uncharacterized iron-regulated membrane protein
MSTITTERAPDDEREPGPGATEPTASTIRSGRSPDDDRRSRFWRAVWRVHFYAGMLVLPVMVMLAITGLLILYGPNLLDRTESSLRLVTPTGTAQPLDTQVAAVTGAFPDKPVRGITPPAAADRSTKVVLLDGDAGANPWDAETIDVYVNPYTATILGTKTTGDDLPGLAERIHGNVLVDVEVPVPTLAGFTGRSDDGVFTRVELGDLLVEVAACWGVILALTGVYLWWPRKRGTGRSLFVPRLGKAGRARWRDLHAIPGVVFSVVLVFMVMTGLPWSGFWGGNWSHLSGEVLGSTNNNPSGVTSTEVRAGELNRFGNRIPWAAENLPVPASAGPAAAAGVPAPLSLDDVARLAGEEGMVAGYSIALPTNATADGQTTWGTYTLANPSEGIENRRTLFVDQFTGQPVVDHRSDDWGRLAWATSFGIDIHEGQQFGLANVVAMTAMCLVLVWSAITGVIMWWKRRPARSVGLPRRPVDASLEKGLVILAVVLGVIFPLAGLTMVAVVLADRFVIRRVPALRTTFGMR